MDDGRQSGLAAQVIPPLIGASVFAAATYVVLDTSIVVAALFGLAFETTMISAKFLWRQLVSRGRGTRTPPA